MKNIIFTMLILASTLLPNIAGAECAKDRLGIVYCSKYATGGAVIDRLGIVQCGKGQCQIDRLGIAYCSRIEGGGAGVDRLGIVKCLGGCESGNTSICEAGK